MESIEWLKGPQTSTPDAQHWNIQLGKTIETVQSSRFCPASLIGQLNEARSNANVLHTTHGKELIKSFDSLLQQKDRDFGQSSNPLNILAVLQQCGLLSIESRRILDISGNARFVSQLMESGVCYPEQCLALLCQHCAVQCDGFGTVAIDSCLSYKASEVEKLRSFGRDLDEERTVKDERLSNDDAAVCCSVQSSPKSRVVLGSSFHHCQQVEHSSYDELSSKTSLLNQCVIALHLLENGDCLVLEMSDTLTQFTVGIIYILYLLFKEIAMICPSFCPTPKQFLVCRGFLNSNQSTTLLAHMERVLETLTNKQREKDVIGFLPIKELFSKKFYQYIRSQSTNHITAQLHWIVKCERLLLSKNA